MFTCERCDYTTLARPNFKRHLFRQYTCRGTDAAPSIITLRSKHFPQIVKPHTCLCGKSFLSHTGLRYHQVLVHSTNTPVAITPGHVNDFCKDNQSYLTKEFINQCAMNLASGIVDMFRHIHFNKDHPENHNIRLVSKHDNIIEIMKDGKWEPTSKSYVLNKAVDYSFMKLSEAYETPEFLNNHSKENRATMLYMCTEVKHPASPLNHIVKRNMFIIIVKDTEMRNKEPLLKDVANTTSQETELPGAKVGAEDNTNGAKESGSNDGASGSNGAECVSSGVPDPKVSPLQLFDRIEHNVQEALV